MQVRILPPQLAGVPDRCVQTNTRILNNATKFYLTEKQADSAKAAVSKTVEHVQTCLGGSTPSLSAFSTSHSTSCVSGRAARVPGFQPRSGAFDSRATLAGQRPASPASSTKVAEVPAASLIHVNCRVVSVGRNP